MEAYPVQTGFPVNGLAHVTPFSDQEAGTSPDMRNVFPFHVSTGRLRGDLRPGLSKFCPDQVSGSNRIQCLHHTSATFVEPVLGDGTAVSRGTTAAATGLSFFSPAAGTETTVATGNTFLAGTFGADGKLYGITSSSTQIKLGRWQTDGTEDYHVNIFTSASSPAGADVAGLAIDEDTLYVWYLRHASLGECIMRFNLPDGSNRDSTTTACWIRAETDATSIELVFGGVASAGWTVIPTTSHSIMKCYQGLMALAAAPLKNGGTAAEHELVLYIVNLKTGIVDAIHDLGLDGTNVSSDQGTLLDLEFGLDGFIYILMKDAGSSNKTFLRKVAVSGDGVWEIEFSSSFLPASISWNPDRSLLAVCGADVLISGVSLILVDPDSKGIVDYAIPGSQNNWNLVRCDKDGNYYLYNATGKDLIKVNSTFSTVWSVTTLNQDDQYRSCINAFWNTGADEQGSTRYQVTTAISNGTIMKVSGSGAAAITNGSSMFSTSATTIYAASFGVLTFFADGENHLYYDSTDNTLYNWADAVYYGRLPEDSNGGFTGIELWNRRLLIFGLEDDPSNYYFSAQGDPFDWKLVPGTTGAAISGRLSPAGLFPDKLVACIPYNDDICIFGGDHSLYQFSLDPAVDGVLDLISDTIGIAPGRAWCKDGYGSVYFLGNNGGFYKLSLDSSPQRISNRSIDSLFESIDLTTSAVHLVWDSIRQGIHVFVRVSDDSAADHYFFDFRTEGWFPYRFASTNHNPTAALAFEGDTPQDRKILLGGQDGYVRQLDSAVAADDGTSFEGHFVLGPWIPREFTGRKVALETLDVAVGAGAQMEFELLAGEDADQAVLDGRSIYQGEVRANQQNFFRPLRSGRALALKFRIFDRESIALESVRMTLREMRTI